jgi:hypothetical protein
MSARWDGWISEVINIELIQAANKKPQKVTKQIIRLGTVMHFIKHS